MKKYPIGIIKKLPGIMRISFLIFTIIASVSGSLLANKSEAQSIEKVKVSISLRASTIDQTIQQLQKISGFNFIYNSRDINGNKAISISAKDKSVKEILDYILTKSEIIYSQEGKTIYLKKRAERGKITGVVRDSVSNETLPGVTITINNKTYQTNVNGQFEIALEPGSYDLSFSYIGFETRELKKIAVRENQKQELQILMSSAQSDLNEVVVVGYGTQKKANLTGAVSTVDFSALNNIPQANTLNILSGRLPGVSVVQGGGQPGAEQSEVTIRGIGTLNDSSPLVIIDGAQASLTDLGNLTPQEIDNVSVLKDASSAAIYGARGANGVILVTTKLPKNEQININLSAYTALQKATYLPKMVESWQYMTLMNEAVENVRYTSDVIDSARNGMFSDNLANTKWFDEIFETAPMQNYNLSVSGKTKGTAFQLSGGLLDQDGIMKGTSSERYTIRGNVKTQVTKNITAGLNVWGYNRDIDEPYDNPSTIIASALQVPIMPVKYANGQYAVWNYHVTGEKTVANPVLGTEIGYTKQNDLKINVQPSLEINIIEGLNLRSAFTYSHDELRTDRFNPTYSYNNNFGLPAYENKISQLNNASNNTRQIQWQTTLNYTKTFNKDHSFSGLLGHEILDYSQTIFNARGDNLPSNSLPVLDNASANFLVGGNKQEWALQSFFGRINYGFKNKYLAEVSLRTDGSSRFNGAYRLSPSASIGWVLSDENFFKSLNPAVSFMKLRAGFGKLGNDRIGNYTFQQVLNLDEYYTVGGNLQTAASINNFGNPDISWEQTTTTNLGLDLGLLKSKLYINLDIYNKVTDGILFQLPLPLSFGNAKAPFQNVAKVSNKGFDLAIEHKNSIGKLTYNVGLNFSYNKNNVDELNKQRVILGAAQAGLNLLQEGYPINSWFGYKSEGLYTQEDEDSGYPKFNETNVVGSLKFKDINGDGVINDEDRTVIGDGSTPYVFGLTGGLNFKGFDFSFLVQGIANKDIYIYDYGNRPGNGGQINFWQEWWTRSYDEVRNPDGDWPIIKSSSPDANVSSSFWLSNASYIRLKNIEIGYTLPTRLLEKIKVKQMRLYVSGQNVLTFSSVPKNLDPERSNFQKYNRTYPQTSVFSAGLNVSF